MIARTAALYLAIFVCVLIALNVGAYAFIAREYASLLAPAMATPEGAAAFGAATRRVGLTLAAIDVPLVAIVAIASYLLARAAIAPLEAARRREREFAADAAHELRSPLAAISATAQAARSSATGDARAAFETIARGALDASAVVADLLTLARDPGRTALQCEPVDLAAIVLESSRETRALATSRGVRIESLPVSAIVDGDARRLRELARNLIENAVRHARASVTVASRRNGRLCEIVVDDDGDGVPPEERERIFQRFYRRANDGTGAGLGLAIARWIASAHDGAIAVCDSPSGGARFVATIPAHAEAP